MGNTISQKVSVDQPFNHLNCSTEPPDVILVIEDTEIPAHRSILSSRSEYFNAMFSNNFIEANSDKIILKETNLKPFKRVLEYFYTGDVNTLHNVCSKSTTSLKDLFEIYSCAQYYVADAVTKPTMWYIVYKGRQSPGQLLNCVIDYSIDELTSYNNYLIKETSDLCVMTLFSWLSPQAVKHVLKLKLNMRESVIFEALVWWMRTYSEHSALFPELLEHVDLYLLEEEQIEMLFKPDQLIDRDFCLNLRNQQEEEAKVVQKIVNENVISSISDLRVVEGTKMSSTYSTVASVASWKQEKPVIIDLKQRYLLNCLKFFIKCNSVRKHLSYTVSVSTDMRDWESIIDYSKYECSGQQNLYFKERAIRFIRIQSDAKYFIIDGKIEALYSLSLPIVDPSSNIIVPVHNFMQFQKLSTWDSRTLGGFISGEIINREINSNFPNTREQHKNVFIRHKSDDDGSIIYKFHQPYIIGSMKLLLGSKKSYYIETATKDENWTLVFAEENVSSMRTATFKKQPVIYIKIVGYSESSEYFYLHNELKCT
uniref:BTB domain-containing protein n=1 Tax=Panagrellus redivivus TaxID=6233 RepID=A0A7E4VS35_PANRE